MITLIGLGSLLSESSANRTCPSVQNFELAQINGYIRSFNKTDSWIVRKSPESMLENKYACLSAMPIQGKPSMVVSTFQIHKDDYDAFVEREFEYKFEKVPFVTMSGTRGTGLICSGNFKSNEECETLCYLDSMRLKHWLSFKESYIGPMWRQDLLPEPEYLKKCLKVCEDHGNEILQNFLQTTYLGDMKTTLKEYLK
jgi:hypothetical protein